MSKADATRTRTRIETGIYIRDGRYQVLVSEGGRTTFKTARTLTEARAVRGGVLAKRAAGQAVMPTARMTFGQAIDEYFAQARIRKTTATLYRMNLDRQAVKKLHGKKLTSITADTIARLVRTLEAEGLSAATVATNLVPLSAVFSLAVRRGWMTTNPVRALTKSERPHGAKRPKRSLSENEIGRVLAAASEPWRTLVLVAVFCGLRQSELLGLVWDDVDLDGGVLHVRRQLARGSSERVELKTEASLRDVPLSATVVAALRRHKLASAWSLPEHPVFASETGEAVKQHRASAWWDRIRKEAKLSAPLPRFHDLRGTCVSILVAESDGDVAYVSQVLGASPAVLLSTYMDLFNGVEKSARVTARVDRVAASAVAGLA